MDIGYVFFDLGLTLLDSNHVPLFKKALECSGVDLPLSEVGRAYHLANKFFMRTRPGDISDNRCFSDYVRLLLDLLSLDPDRYLPSVSSSLACFKKEVRWTKYPFTDAVVSALKDNGINVGLISNWDCGCRKLLSDLGLADKLDPIVVSSEVGCAKPDRRIFELALQKAGVDARRCLYVGDNYYDDVVGASGVGMRTILINSPGLLGIEETGYGYVAEDIRGVMRYL